MANLEISVPAKLLPLMKPARYRAAYGGRGGAKSHFFASLVVILCYSKKTRIACIRQVQASIRDSVRQLIIDKISQFGLENHFDILENEIRGRNGSLVVFKGMQAYNAHNIKSLEDFDIAWVEEAQTFSETSLKLLRPTIRKPGSEIWFSWNPRHESDPVDHFFRGNDPNKQGKWKKPEDAIVVEVQWSDNPWLSRELLRDKDHDYAADPEAAEHVWGGGYERVTEGAYYARMIAEIERMGRVGFFPHLPDALVYTGWDLGIDDYTAIWFFQVHRAEDGEPRVRVIDYYEASGLGADEIVAQAMPEYTTDFQDRVAAMVELGRSDPFAYGRHFLPHDVGMREWGAGGRTRLQTMNALGIPPSHMNRGVAQGPEERINAVRRLLPFCEFLQSPRVMLGLSRLRRYSRKKNEQLGIYGGVLHDENSHGADAFGEFAVNCGVSPPEPVPELPPPPPPGMIPPPPVKKRRKRL